MDHVLLGKEEEKQLGSSIQAWMHVERVRRSILEEDGIWPDKHRLAMALGMEVEDMERVIKMGEESRRKLILSNIALVRKIARRYEGFRMESSDLILAGILGLCLAADRYEPEKGTRFSTFAFWCIRMKIRKAAEKESNVLKVSSEFWTLVPKVKGVAADLENKLNRQPTAKEIGQVMGMKPTKVQCIINAASPHAQLDITIPFHAGTTGAMPPSMITGDEECAYTRVQAEESGKILALILNKSLGHELLSKIIKMHFGIDEPNGRSMSLREIARELSIGPELCRCYLYTGLDHLRANAGIFRLLFDSYA